MILTMFMALMAATDGTLVPGYTYVRILGEGDALVSKQATGDDDGTLVTAVIINGLSLYKQYPGEHVPNSDGVLAWGPGESASSLELWFKPVILQAIKSDGFAVPDGVDVDDCITNIRLSYDASSAVDTDDGNQVYDKHTLLFDVRADA